MTTYRVTVEVERVGKRAFQTRVLESSVPEELPADMADYLYRQHGIDPRDHGSRVEAPTESDRSEWIPPGLREDAPGEGEGPPDHAGPPDGAGGP